MLYDFIHTNRGVQLKCFLLYGHLIIHSCVGMKNKYIKVQIILVRSLQFHGNYRRTKDPAKAVFCISMDNVLINGRKSLRK